MSEYITVKDLLDRNVRALPEKDIDLPNGEKVRIRALGGYLAMKCIENDIADKTVIAITDGLVEPKIKPSMVREFIDQHVHDADHIASEVGALTKEFNEAESAEVETAKKNS